MQNIQQIVKKYSQLFDKFFVNNYDLFIVGGAVRDLLIGKEPKDVDFATDATPDEMREIFREDQILSISDNSSQFGTLFIKYQDETVEITTFRKDITRGRHPQTAFTIYLDEDAQRRDFTINAMYIDMHGELHEPIAPTTQHYDVLGGVLRTVGFAPLRFAEDPLRLLRAIRFIAMGYQPDMNIEQLLSNPDFCKMIYTVSIERIRDEFLRCLSIDPQITMRWMLRSGMISFILPEFVPTIGFYQETPYHYFTLDKHLILTAQRLHELGADPELILIGLCHDISKVATASVNNKGNMSYIGHDRVGAEWIVRKFSRDLKMSNKSAVRAMELLKHHMRLHQSHSQRNLLKTSHLMFQSMYATAEDLVMLWKADVYASRLEETNIKLPPPPELPDEFEFFTVMKEFQDEMNEKNIPLGVLSQTMDKVWHWIYKKPDLSPKTLYDRSRAYLRQQINSYQ